MDHEANVEVLVNPTPGAVVKMMREVNYNRIRATRDLNANVFVWNAYDAIHRAMFFGLSKLSGGNIKLDETTEEEWALENGRLSGYAQGVLKRGMENARKAKEQYNEDAYDPDEPRDPHGEWTSGGADIPGTHVIVASAKSEGPKIIHRDKLPYFDLPEPKYIRFGNIPKSGKSKVWTAPNYIAAMTGEVGRTLPGLSVFRVKPNKERNLWQVDDDLADSGYASLDELISRQLNDDEIVSGGHEPVDKDKPYGETKWSPPVFEWKERKKLQPIYLMTGDENQEEEGTDGEPLLNNAKILDKLNVWDILHEGQYFDPDTDIRPPMAPKAFGMTFEEAVAADKAMIEAERARYAAASAKRSAEDGFNPDQPRNERGEWTTGAAPGAYRGEIIRHEEQALKQQAEAEIAAKEGPQINIPPEVKVVGSFHGTTKEVFDNIKKNGLVPHASPGADEWAKQHDMHAAQEFLAGSRIHSVYVSADPAAAMSFARVAANVRKQHPILLHVEIPREEAEKHLRVDMAADPSELRKGQSSLARYNGVIKPEWISEVKVPDEIWGIVEGPDIVSTKTGKISAHHDADTVPVTLIVFDPLLGETRDAYDPSEARNERGEWTAGGWTVAPEPTNKMYGYKTFNVGRDGALYPAMVRDKRAIPLQLWLKAEFTGKDPNLKDRPGWHMSKLPTAKQLRGVKSKKISPDRVWAKVAMGADTEIHPPKGGLIGRTPEPGEYYHHKQGASQWLIGGSVKVIKVLSDKEVREILEAHGVPEKEIRGEMHSRDGEPTFFDVAGFTKAFLTDSLDAFDPAQPRNEKGEWTSGEEDTPSARLEKFHAEEKRQRGKELLTAYTAGTLKLSSLLHGLELLGYSPGEAEHLSSIADKPYITEAPWRSDEPKVFYHGTSAAAIEDIRKFGLKPHAGPGGDAWFKAHMGQNLSSGDRKFEVYFTNSKAVASSFARKAAEVRKSAPAVLAIHLPESEADKVHHDEQGDGAMFAYTGEIKPAWIGEEVENVVQQEPSSRSSQGNF